MTFHLPSSILALLCVSANAQPMPEFPVIPPPVRTFAATSYLGTNESAPSESVTTTNGYPFMISFMAPPMPVDGFKLYMTNRLRRVAMFDLGTNTTYTVAAPTSTPAPPFNLVLTIAPATFTVTNHDEPQRFWRAVVQTSTNLTAWETFSGLQTSVARALSP